MLADGNGDYARALGLELDGRGFGMGMRGQRFAIVVDNGVVTHVNVEAPGQFKSRPPSTCWPSCKGCEPLSMSLEDHEHRRRRQTQ